MAQRNGHPRVRLTPQAVRCLRGWMRDRGVTGTAEGLIGGLVGEGEEVITDTVIGEVMAYVDQLIALHGARWFHVLTARGDGTDNGVLPIEPRLN